MSDWERPIEALSSTGAKELRRLQAENEKLRELVWQLYGYAYDEYPDGVELNFMDKLHELGIEVEP